MVRTSRRRFLKTAGVAAASPAIIPAPAVAENAAGKHQRRTSFAPNTKLRKLSENLYVLEDTCNVYLIRDGSHALLIDFGSGNILDYLQGLGITEAW